MDISRRLRFLVLPLLMSAFLHTALGAQPEQSTATLDAVSNSQPTLAATIGAATSADDASTAAQDQTNAASGTAAQGAATLQEVVVTAERRAISEQETPIQITAISGDTLISQHQAQIQDLQVTVPALADTSDVGNLEYINIRGVGNATPGPNIASGVAVLQDGILMATREDQSQPFYDMADVEVLEGPQGTFVGASAIAGAIEMTSANPNFNGVSGYVLAKEADYSDTQFQGATNLPVSDTFAVRFAFNVEQSGSFYKDIGDTPDGYGYASYSATNPALDGARIPLDQFALGPTTPQDPGAIDDKQARVKALWQPTDSFQSLTEFSYWYQNNGNIGEPNPYTYQTLFSAGSENAATGLQGGCTLGGPLSAKQEICSEPGTTTHSTYYYPGETPLVLDYYGFYDEDYQQALIYNETLRYTFPDGIVLRSQTGIVNINDDTLTSNSDGPANAGWGQHDNGNVRWKSEEINLLSPTTGKVNWIVGGFYDYETNPSYITTLSVPPPYQPNALPSTLSIAQNSAAGRVMAIFGQLNWQLTKTLQLQIGARENWDNNYSPNWFPVAPPPGTVLSAPAGAGSYKLGYTGTSTVPSSYTVTSVGSELQYFKDSVPTGKINLEWIPVPGQNFYIFYARGYQAGGTNQGSTDHPVFEPEYNNDYEAGWKGRLFDGHMLTQVGGFYYNLQNFQESLFDGQANNDTTTGTYTANMAPSRLDGLEASEQSRFGGLGINLGVAYTHSSMGTLKVFPSYAEPAGFGSPETAPQCVAGHTYVNTCFDYTPYLINVGGEEMPYAPDFTANITVDYRFRVGNGTFDPQVMFSHMSSQYSGIYDIPYFYMPARNLWNAYINYTVGRWDMQLFGTNLTNEIYANNIGTTITYGAPRSGGIQASFKF